MSSSLLVPGSTDSPSPRPASPPVFQTRFLALQDVPSLLRLEARQWTPDQAASEEMLVHRITSHPELCVGSFCPHTGEAVSSLFMRPIQDQDLARLQSWADGAQVDAAPAVSTRSLFGISLTSVNPDGAWGLIKFFWPYALRQGWRDIYLGSPIPGLRQALNQEPGLTVQRYVFDKKRGLPRDPQLRYYHRNGFREIVAVKANYFPHAASLDHGVLLRGRVPLSGLWPLWRLLPWSWMQRFSRWAEAAL